MPSVHFSNRLFFALALSFFVTVIAGTLSHEFGHYAVARFLGFDARIGYDYTSWYPSAQEPTGGSGAEPLNRSGSLSDSVLRVKNLSKELGHTKAVYRITLGGPVQTLFTGTLGFVLLMAQRKKNRAAKNLTRYQWFCIFLALFWLRQVVNLFTWLMGYFCNGGFSLRGDEVKLAVYAGLPPAALVTGTAVIGVLIAGYVVFWLVPREKRFTFILAGLFGGLFGYLFWMEWAGPYLMP